MRAALYFTRSLIGGLRAHSQKVYVMDNMRLSPKHGAGAKTQHVDFHARTSGIFAPMGAERRILIWQTVAAVALATAAMVAPSLFPNMPWWLLWLLFGGAVLLTIIAFLALYSLLGKTEGRPSEVNSPVSVPRESSENKPIPTWQIVAVLVATWIFTGGVMTYAFMTQPEYTAGLKARKKSWT